MCHMKPKVKDDLFEVLSYFLHYIVSCISMGATQRQQDLHKVPEDVPKGFFSSELKNLNQVHLLV